MKKLFTLLAGATLLSGVALSTEVQAAPTTPNSHACWGQATKVFAAMGDLGEHASQEATPRQGLRNLARELYEVGILFDDTLQELGAWVAGEMGLTIDACE